jgi:MoaA/NifB/PqqE/SkfB family radical SAM enzyme
MVFDKQYDIKHKIQRLYVHWDVSTQCNLKCSYCYAIKEYGDDWDKIDHWGNQRLVLRNLERSTLPIFLGLLGGEPTMHPKYDELIERAHSAISKHKDGRIYVTTNGTKPTEWFKNHKFYDNMYFLWSAHFEYEMKYGKGFDLILENIKVMKEKGFRNKVNVMLHPNPKLWHKIHDFVDKLEYIGGIEIHPHFLYDEGDVHRLHQYTPEFYEEFKRFESYPGYLVFEGESNKVVYNDYTIFNNKMTSFTGWDCFNNNYEISWKGDVQQFCFNDRDSLLTNFNFFKDIEKVVGVSCPHTTCNCDGLLKIYKEKL